MNDIKICSVPGCDNDHTLLDHVCHDHWIKRVLKEVNNVHKFIDDYANAKEQDRRQFDILERAFEKEFERGLIKGFNENCINEMRIRKTKEN